ncbi:MAG: hypothetical protein ACE5OR_11895 [bacterium]
MAKQILVVGVVITSVSPLALDFNGNYWSGMKVTGDAEELSPRYRSSVSRQPFGRQWPTRRLTRINWTGNMPVLLPIRLIAHRPVLRLQ